MVLKDGDPQDVLEEKLRASGHEWSLPSSLSVGRTDLPYAIGLDTNVLKRLRGADPLVLDRFTQKVRSNSVLLVVPGQSITEFWNRHQTFTEDVVGPVRASLTSSLTKLEDVRGIVTATETVDRLIGGIEELLENLAAASPKEAMEKTLTFWGALEDVMHVSYCERSRFSQLVEARQRTKHPPGFADEKSKQNAAGDSFVWLDFLLCLLKLGNSSAESEPVPNREVWFVTDDRKSDWWSGHHAHPVLVHEARTVCDADLKLVTTGELFTWSRG